MTQKNMEISHSRVDDSLLAPLGHLQCEASFKRPDHPREGGRGSGPAFLQVVDHLRSDGRQ